MIVCRPASVAMRLRVYSRRQGHRGPLEGLPLDSGQRHPRSRVISPYSYLLRRTVEFILILLLHRDSFISTHFISETKRLSFSYLSSVYLEEVITYEGTTPHTQAHKHISYTSLQKQIFLFPLYKSSTSGLASGVQEARGSKGLRQCLGRMRLGREKERGNVERLLSIIIKIYTPVCTTYVSS